MVNAERRAEFSQAYMASHRSFQDERDRQYEIYKFTCKGNQGARDRELARLDPGDQAGIALAHDTYDTHTRRASHLYERYEQRAWAKHEARAAELRAKYGIMEVPE